MPSWWRPNRPAFDRPLFIIAMPRSGSTLLFDLLASHEQLRSWGDEAYPPWRAIDPALGSGERGDAFDPATLDATARRRAEAEMHAGVNAHHGETRRPFRLLDKTPPNVLRVAALAALWPDAYFVHLVRDAPASIASMLEGRERRLAVRDWPQRQGIDWHFLMPPGWLEHVQEAPAAQFAWQWEVGNRTATDDLAAVAPDRWLRLRYEDLIAAPGREVAAVLDLAGLQRSSRIDSAVAAMAPTKHTLSAPSSAKWRERAEEIEPVLEPLAELRSRYRY